MSVDYRPELGALKSLRPFVFWAQTTLPTVFDDSLSYYEVLTKLTNMVNTLLENTDTTEENVEALATAYDELQAYVNDYFDNLDVTTEIDNKLEEWRSAGIIDNMVDSYVAPIIHDYLYGPDDEGGVQKTLEDMLADATESLNNALSTFSTDSRQALNDFERDSRDALTDFEDATDDALDAIPTTVDAWLDQNFTNPSSPPLDETLSLENAAAQAKATGERCDQLEDLVLSNNDWINSVSEVESNQYVVVNNDGTNPRIANDASSDPLRPMSVANITGGRSYLISCVGNTVGPNTFSPAYAICNLSYDLRDEPVYTILDFYPRSWDPQVKTYEIIRSKSVYIPETIGLQTVNCLILMGNTDITVTPKCGVLSVKTDNTLTDPLLPANSKAVGDALANKLPWPVTEGQKDLGTNGKALLSSGDGTTHWGDVGGDYDQEIAELQSDVSDLKSSLNETSTIEASSTWTKGVLSADGSVNTSVNGVCSDYLTRLDMTVKITDAKASIHFYDHRCQYIGKINSSGNIDKVGGDWKWFYDDVNVFQLFPQNAYFYKISVYPNTETITDAQEYGDQNIVINKQANIDTAYVYNIRNLVTTHRTWNGSSAYVSSNTRNALTTPQKADTNTYISCDANHFVSVQYFSGSAINTYVNESGWTKIAAVPAGTYWGVAIKNSDQSATDDTTTESVTVINSTPLYSQIDTIANRLKNIPNNYDAYIIDSNMRKIAIRADGNYLGALTYSQAFCIVNGHYYSTDGAHIAEQDDSFVVLRNVEVAVGHGNAMQSGNDNELYVWGWNDQTVYVVDIETLTVTETIELPTSGYTTGAIDSESKIAFIFNRPVGADTLHYPYTFIAYDYENNVELYRTITQSFSAIQGVTMFNGLLFVVSGLGTTTNPSKYRVYTRHGDCISEYFFPNVRSFNILEPEGIAFDENTGVKYVSFANRDVYRFDI